MQHSQYAAPSWVFDNDLLVVVITDAVCITSTDGTRMKIFTRRSP